MQVTIGVPDKGMAGDCAFSAMLGPNVRLDVRTVRVGRVRDGRFYGV